MKNWEKWQKPYQFGTIVLWPPDEIREIVNAQRERYDPISQSYCETHISVTQPLARLLSDNEWDQVEKLLQEFEPFDIRYGPLNSFLPYPCIWYEIRPKAQLLKIRTALHKTGFFNLEMKYPENFTPHMTITEGLSGPSVNEKLLNQLQDESKDGSFPCDHLAYIVPDDQFRFEFAKVLPLGKTLGNQESTPI